MKKIKIFLSRLYFFLNTKILKFIINLCFHKYEEKIILNKGYFCIKKICKKCGKNFNILL